MPQDGILPSTDDLLRQRARLTPDQIAGIHAAPSTPPVTYARGLAPPAGTLPANYLDNGYAAILGTQSGFGNLSVAPPPLVAAPSTNGAVQPIPQPVDASGRSTMPINADPSLYGPGTPGAAANQHFGPGPPTPLAPQPETVSTRPDGSGVTPEIKLPAAYANGGGDWGLRHNNPGNLGISPSLPFSERRVYATPEEGVAAIAHQLDLYASRGNNTVAGMVSTWAPPNENNTPELIARAARHLGVDPNQPINLKDPEVRRKMVEATILNEHGGIIPAGYDDGVIVRGMQMEPPKSLSAGSLGGSTDLSNNPGYQRVIEQQNREIAQREADYERLRTEFEKTDPNSPARRRLLDSMVETEQQLRQRYLDKEANPPTQKPVDFFQNFGSLATVIGVLGGALSRRGLAGSLDAAGAAMEAINENNFEQWQQAYKIWDKQSDMLSKAVEMEHTAYRDVLDDERLSMEDKWNRYHELASLYQNKEAIEALRTGNLEKAWRLPYDLQAANDKHDEVRANIGHVNAEAEKAHAETRETREMGPYLDPKNEEDRQVYTVLAKKAQDEKRDVTELTSNPDEVNKAHETVTQQRAEYRQGPVISDETAQVAAGELLAGDTSVMIRQNPSSRDKIRKVATDMVFPQMLTDFEKEKGAPATPEETQHLRSQIGVRMAAARAEFTGFTQYERSLAIRQAMIDSAVEEARKMMPVALEMSDKVDRTQFPTLNSILLAGERKTGGEAVVRLGVATLALLNTYSRAVTPTGQATDMVRKQAQDQLEAAYSKGQYKAAVQMMNLEMQNAQSAPEEVRLRRREEFLQHGGASFTADETTPFLQRGVGGTTGGGVTPKPAWAPEQQSHSGMRNGQKVPVYENPVGSGKWFYGDQTPYQEPP